MIAPETGVPADAVHLSPVQASPIEMYAVPDVYVLPL